LTKKQEKILVKMAKNMKDGIDYYYNMFAGLVSTFKKDKDKILLEISSNRRFLRILDQRIELLVQG
jgi:hypothetical protein